MPQRYNHFLFYASFRCYKILALIIAIVLGITFGASAQNQGLFGLGPQRGDETSVFDNRAGGGLLGLPSSHGKTTDQPAPLGGGAILLIGFGAAHALKKRKDA